MGLVNNKPTGTYVSIKDGTLRVKADNSQEGAIKREYTKKVDGVETQVTVWEFEYTELTGKISGIEFKENDWGRQIYIKISDGEGDAENILILGTKDNYGNDVLKKLPNIDFTKKVVLKPYSFVGDNNKQFTGVSVQQEGVKILGAFYNPETKKALLGIPVAVKKDIPPVAEKTERSAFWSAFFTNQEIFLVKYAKNNVLGKIPKGDSGVTPEEKADKEFKGLSTKKGEIDPEEIPFD